MLDSPNWVSAAVRRTGGPVLLAERRRARTVSSTVRPFVLFVLVSLAGLPSVPVRAAIPARLEGALQQIADNYDRWAYTQIVVEKDAKGQISDKAIVRFDPSRPYAEQYTPIAIDDQPPSPRQRRKYRRQGEKRGRKIDEAAGEGAGEIRKTLGELMDFKHATVAAEDDRSVTYEVPLKHDSDRRLPPEKFRVTARVSKTTGSFETIDVRLRESMRTDLVVKITSGVGRLEFTPVAPSFPSALTQVHGSGAGSILLVPVGRSYDMVRTDFVRVKPYNERLEVKLGPLQSIDF
jgi:hypothetical protein